MRVIVLFSALAFIHAVCAAPAKSHPHHGHHHGNMSKLLLALTEQETCSNWGQAEGATPLYWGETNPVLTLSTGCHLTPPTATDNYVSDARTNAHDPNPTEKPMIRLVTHQASGTGFGADNEKKFAWSAFVGNEQTSLDTVTLTAPGIYTVTLYASDYGDVEASCPACVAVQDNYGAAIDPELMCASSTGTTPAAALPAYGVADDGNKNLVAAQNAETEFATFKASPPLNNAWGTLDHTSLSSRTDFFSDTADDTFNVDTKCFDLYEADLIAAINGINPFAAGVSDDDRAGYVCKRTCVKTWQLTEHYTAYSCLSNVDAPKVRNGDSCGFGYSISMPPDSLISAVPATTSAANTVSTRVVAGLSPPGSVGTHEIHVTVHSTSFTSYPESGTLLLSSLIDVTTGTSWGANIPGGVSSGKDANDYLYWRYKLNSGDWAVFTPATTTISFTALSNTIKLEAWTRCGKLLLDDDTITFTVIVHKHESVDVCSASTFPGVDTMAALGTFSASNALTEDGGNTLCADSKSDFASFHFAYASTPATPTAGSVTAVYTDATCKVKVASTGNVASVADADAQSLTSGVAVTSGAVAINSFFAVELVHSPSTAAKTDAEIECTLSFIYRDEDPATATPTTRTCSHAISITDCDPPELITSGAVCPAGTCQGPDGAPGPYEACAGSVFQGIYTAATTKYTTSSKAPAACCSGTGCSLTCTALALPAGNTVSRCEPPVQKKKNLLAAAIELKAMRSAKSAKMQTAWALGGVGMLLVAAAVVVVHKQHSKVKQQEEDVYYPLLE